MKKTLLLLWIAFLSLSLFANPIDKNTALKIANNFYTIQLKKASPTFTLVYECTSQAWSVNKATPIEKETYYYVFNNADNGFIIISGDDATYPVLGYSDTGSYDTQIQATNFLKWMENYKQQIRYIVKNNIPATAEIKAEWNNILKGKSVAKNSKTVSALVTTKWSQSPYENADCPADDEAGYSNGYHAVAGCPATAMAQIMKYWEYPVQGDGFHSYNHDKYGTLSANFASTTYNWAAMTNQISSANPAIAELMYHCGVGVEMGYGPHSSGSYVILAYTSKPEACSEYAYTNYFDYEITVGGKMREDYSDATWKQMLKTDLDAGQPIQYAGFGQGGHTFVCDGYDASDYFHFNWGWGGHADGYFLIDNLNPGDEGTGSGAGIYNNNQQAIFGLKPADGSGAGGSGGGSTDGFDLQLNDILTVSPTEIYYGQGFTVHSDIINNGTATFNGDYGAALFDSEYNFVDFIYIKENYELQPNYHYTNGLNFSTDQMLAALPGNYYIALFYRVTGENWKVIGDDSQTNLVALEVSNDNAIALYDDITISTGDITQNESFSISLDMANHSLTVDFEGSFTINLYNLEDGSFIENIALKENMNLAANNHYQNGLTFSPCQTDIEAGSYLLAVLHKRTGESWELTGSQNYTNPIKVTVKTPALVGDMYEGNNGNNTEANAYDLSSGLTKTSTILTTGSNMHNGEDIDYYKIDLPAGFNYTINARAHDSYNTGNGVTYTNDVNWMYLYDGIWSDAYDDVMPNTFQINNGGSLIFSVSPYFIGTIGDYLLDIQVTNDGAYVSGIEDVNFVEKIKIYPIPAKDFLTVDVREFPAKVNKLNFISLSGKKIKADFNTNEKLIKLPVGNLSNGVFILSIETENGVIQKKVLINK